MIVEDDADTCEAMVGMLRAEGLEAECARTVGEALVELEIGSKPAAVLLDLGLPDASGSIVMWRVRRNWGHDVPVAVVTGRPELLSCADILRERPEMVFTKPVDFSSLIAWVKSVTVC